MRARFSAARTQKSKSLVNFDGWRETPQGVRFNCREYRPAAWQRVGIIYACVARWLGMGRILQRGSAKAKMHAVESS